MSDVEMKGLKEKSMIREERTAIITITEEGRP